LDHALVREEKKVMSNRLLTSLAAISMVCATLGAAVAQTAQPANGPGSPGFHQAQDPIARHNEHCANRYARTAAALAFLEARLNLTESQKASWTAWRQASLDDAAQMRDTCVADVPVHPGTPPTVLEREAQKEKMMSARLAGLQARRPALQALYAVLTPEQQATFDHLAMAAGHRHHWHHGMMMERQGG
jgi:Spy/CpxP family protein refolding chaperone